MSSKSPKKWKNFNAKKRAVITPGQHGFMATCNFREKDCVRECYNLLNQYADEMYGPEFEPPPPVKEGDAPVEELDVSECLQQEIDAVTKTAGAGKKPEKRTRFQVVDTAIPNCIFITTTLPDPVALGLAIINDIVSSREAKSRYLLRLIPIEVVCRANLPDIVKTTEELCKKHFEQESCSFSVVFNRRYNNSIERDNVIPNIAAVVSSKNADNRVDLKNPDKTVVVEIMKGLCCMGVIPKYQQHKKYNIVELAKPESEAGEKKSKMADDDDELPKEVIGDN